MNSWSNFAYIAKSALSTAQKKIDNVLDIRENQSEEHAEQDSASITASSNVNMNKLRDDFFSAFGLQSSSPSSSNEPVDKLITDEGDVKHIKKLSSKSPSPWSSWLNVDQSFAPNSDPQVALKTDDPALCDLVYDKNGKNDSDETAPAINSSSVDSLVEDVALSPGVEVVVSTSSQLTLVDSDATFECFTNDESTVERLPRSLFAFDSNDRSHAQQEDIESQVFPGFNHQPEESAEREILKDVALLLRECIDHILDNVSVSSSTANSDEESLEDPIAGGSKSLDDSTLSVVKGSGYSSPYDDIETNVSSDIEVISTPNGDYGSERSYRSGDLWSAPATGNAFKDFKGGYSNSNVKSNNEADQKLEHLSKVLEVREKRLLDLSTENVKLSMENVQLRKELRDSCQNKIGIPAALEREINPLTKEKRKLEQRVEFLEKEMSTRISMQQFQQVVADKERQIEELMKEGEKLALKELKYTNIVKKLREGEAENAKIIKKQKEKLEELESLREQLKSKESQELKYDETVSELRKIVEKQDKLIERLRKDLEDSDEKCSGYKNAMNNLNNENAAVRRTLAEAKMEIETLRSTFNESVQASLESQLENIRQEKSELERKFALETEGLKAQHSDNLKQFQQREEALKEDLKRLELKLQEAEWKDQNHMENTTNATRPLIQQIESLRTSIQNQQANFERVEQSLFDKLVQAERDCAVWKEKEQNIRQAFDQYRFACAKTDSELATVRSEVTSLNRQLTVARRDLAESLRNNEQLKEALEKETVLRLKGIEDLQREKEILISQFEFEKNQMKSLAEQKLAATNEKLSQQEQLVQSLQCELEEFKRNQLRRESSMSNRRLSESSFFEYQNEDIAISSELPTGSYTNIMEHLRAKLQERERDIWICREELRSMQLSRDSLAASLTLLNNEKLQLEFNSTELDHLKQEFSKLNRNYEALLQMYGEKVEENEELKLDLIDVKALYRQHIEELVNKNSAAASNKT